MNLTHLPFDASLGSYGQQADELLAAYRSGDADAIRLLHEKHPRFLDEKIPWLQKDVSDEEIRDARLGRADMQLALARWYDFRDWPSLLQYAESVASPNSPAYRFEAAVEAVVKGDAAALQSLLLDHPDLVCERSLRVTHFDPAVHRCTLLHYVAANGVEGYRQKTPPNAVRIARLLLEAGAEADALADLYGVPCTTMDLLVSSCHPANAGLQVALAETLLDYGAEIEGRGSGKWGSPLVVALAFGYGKTAEALAKRGARLDLVASAGLGLVETVQDLLEKSDAEERHRAFALAAQHGQIDVVRLLLDAGEDPSRYNPENMHSHSTPLHQAVAADHPGMVKLLVDRGTRLDVRDRVYRGTPLDWAIYLKKPESEQYIRQHGGRLGKDVEDAH